MILTQKLIFQIVIYGAQNILTEETSPEGFLVLKIIHSYLELDMYASLTFHTETTLATGRKELQRYSDLIKVYLIGPCFKIGSLMWIKSFVRNISGVSLIRSHGIFPKHTHTSTSSTTLKRKG